MFLLYHGSIGLLDIMEEILWVMGHHIQLASNHIDFPANGVLQWSFNAVHGGELCLTMTVDGLNVIKRLTSATMTGMSGSPECKSSHQTNKQERNENPPYKQDHLLLFTVNKDNWPIWREYLSHVAIIMQNGRLPAKITSSAKSLPSFRHGSYIQ